MARGLVSGGDEAGEVMRFSGQIRGEFLRGLSHAATLRRAIRRC